MATPPTPAHANTVGWYILEGYPWWPVYICDQFKLRAHLHQLGDGHKKILKKAKDFHRDYALVYYFGSHDFSLVKLNKGILKPWECSEKDQYVKGHPKHLMKKGTVADELSFAVQEVEDYLSQPEDMRLPPHMVPSDLDPTLEPPPPMERPEDMEDAEGEDGEAGSDADAGDDGEDADADGDEDMDEDGEKKAKKKPAKETKKKASAKKEKTEKEKKPKKEKKEKVTKSPKEKKEKAKTPVKEKKVSAAKKKSDDAAASDMPKEKTAKLKRQRSSGGDDDADANDAAKASKQPKKDKAADVKSSETTVGEALNDSEDLQEILEREIRWILSNEQYEEMTTKMLRKVLEERLKRDLKQHREAIKAVVTRVIEEEEDAAADTTAVATEVAITSAAVGSEDAAKDEANGQEDADGDVKMAEDETEKTEKPPATSEPTPEPVTPSNAEKSTEADDDDAPEEPTKEEEVVKEETENDDVEAETEAEKETEPAPPKPVEEADILAIKDKLLHDKTPHDELLACLNELQQMPLDFSHLKQTGIPRVVAKLRQHANDKVSIAAKELRNAWMELVEKEKQPKSLKMLEKMRDTLESETEPETAKLRVLKELTKLKLSTQEIIDAKIGVSISKLRKSSNADLAQAANNLRQKWKKMAQSS